MKTICTKSLILFTLFGLLLSCGNDKSKEKKIDSTEAPQTSSKKEEPVKKNTTVRITGTIDGTEIVFEADPEQNSVVLLNERLELKFTSTNNQAVVVLVLFNDKKIYDGTPNTFTQQEIASEQFPVEVKASMLSFSAIQLEGKLSNQLKLMEGAVILKEFNDDKIVVNFKGQGVLLGDKKNLFPMEGDLVIENYEIGYDGRFELE